jgi:hypothetical protein
MSFSVETDVVLDSEEMSSVDGDAPGIGVVNRISDGIGVSHFTIHVEVDGIATNDAWLTYFSKFSVGDASSDSSTHLSVEHHMSSILLSPGISISLNNNVPGE